MSAQTTYSLRPGPGYPGLLYGRFNEVVSRSVEGAGVKPGTFVFAGTLPNEQVKAARASTEAPLGVAVREHRANDGSGNAAYSATDPIGVVVQGLVWATVAGNPSVGDKLAVKPSDGTLAKTGTNGYTLDVNATVEIAPNAGGLALIRLFPQNLGFLAAEAVLSVGAGLGGLGTSASPLTLDLSVGDGLTGDGKGAGTALEIDIAAASAGGLKINATGELEIDVQTGEGLEGAGTDTSKLNTADGNG